MHCLYCKKRLWLFFSKEREFCSKRHQAAYHDELSAMQRLTEFTVPVELPKGPLTADQTRSQRQRDSRLPMLWPVAVPPMCNLVVTWERPKPIAADPAAGSVPLQEEPFAGSIRFPSTSKNLIAFSLASEVEPAQETANDMALACRVKSKRRRTDPRSSGAFSSRTHRRRAR
jgi:hypothetical protein